MTAPCPRSLSFEIERNLHEADKVRRGFASFLSDNGVDSDIVNYLELAIYEIIVNVIEHGDIQCNDRTVRVYGEINGGLFSCSFNYSGSEYNINNHKMPNLEEHFKSGKDGGLGIYMIKSLMDEVDYRHNEGENWLKIIKSVN